MGSVTEAEVIEVFKRMNATNYSLNNIEINNAVYAGALMKLVSRISAHEFFDIHRIFRPTDIKRMGDVRFVLSVIATMVDGYFNRDEKLERFLSIYNETFPDEDILFTRLSACFDFIDECGFPSRSRIWKRSDIFTALVQIDIALCSGVCPDPLNTLQRLEHFFDQVDSEESVEGMESANIYAKASLQASNDRINRVRRGVIFEAVMTGTDPNQALSTQGLL